MILLEAVNHEGKIVYSEEFKITKGKTLLQLLLLNPIHLQEI